MFSLWFFFFFFQIWCSHFWRKEGTKVDGVWLQCQKLSGSSSPRVWRSVPWLWEIPKAASGAQASAQSSPCSALSRDLSSSGVFTSAGASCAGPGNVSRILPTVLAVLDSFFSSPWCTSRPGFALGALSHLGEVVHGVSSVGVQGLAPSPAASGGRCVRAQWSGVANKWDRCKASRGTLISTL